MNWPDFFLICFLVGLGLSALALLTGSIHLHFHVPHVGHVHTGTGPSGFTRGAQLPWLNFGTIAGFLCWFGGTGYLLSHVYGVWFVAALAVSVLSGLGGASLVFWFVAKVLMGREAPLDPADYSMVGVLGHLSLPIRAGGTGEIIYSQEGTRRVAGARSEDGAAIPRGAEVLVTRYEKGIAYVRPWEDPLAELERKS
ncbi:MAG TPA: hypothetical protein VMU19_14030 [Bryobacteraceae bacterium]|nr:hypothetical protein [Bryobacteraceae bacterium]